MTHLVRALQFLAQRKPHPALKPGEEVELRRGLTLRQNANNPFTVLTLRYYADPEKDPQRDGRDWFLKTASDLGGVASSGWRREYEIDFRAQPGHRVFDQFDARQHVIAPRKLPEWYHRYVLIDYGARNPTAILWFAFGEGKHYVEAEWYQAGAAVRESALAFHLMCLELHAPETLRREVKYDAASGEWTNRQALEDWESRFYQDVLIDPSTVARNERETKTILERFEENGVYPGLANRALDGLKTANEWFLEDRFFIFATCPHTIREVQNLVWAEHSDPTRNYRESEVDRDNHTTDCLKYYANLFPTEGAEPEQAARPNPHTEDLEIRRVMEEAKAYEEQQEAILQGGIPW